MRREVALKVFRRAGLPWAVVRDEASIVGEIESSHVVVVHRACDESSPHRYLDLRYLRGAKSLELGEGIAPATVVEAVRWGIEASRGLKAAHEKKVFHRDIKPANMLWTPQGIVLSDFGGGIVAEDQEPLGLGHTRRVGQGRGIVGTPLYMAPEMLEMLIRHFNGIEQHPSDLDLKLSDIFSLGASIHEFLAGCHRLDLAAAPDLEHLLEAARSDQSVVPTSSDKRPRRFSRVSRRLCRIVGRAVAPAEQRYQSVEALLLDLEAWTNNRLLSDENRLTHPFLAINLWALRKPVVATLFGGILVVLLTVIGSLGIRRELKYENDRLRGVGEELRDAGVYLREENAKLRGKVDDAYLELANAADAGVSQVRDALTQVSRAREEADAGRHAVMHFLDEARKARAEADAGRLAVLQARDEADAGWLAMLQARDEADAGRLATLHAKGEADAGRFAVLQARDEADAGRLVAIQARGEADAGRLAMLQARDEADAGRLVAIQARGEADAGRLAMLQARDEADAGRLVAIQARGEADAGRLAMLQARDEADAGRLVATRARGEAEAAPPISQARDEVDAGEEPDSGAR